MTTNKILTQANLNQFTGSENWYRHPLARKVLYTDGVQYMAEHGGAYWLIDAIVFAQADCAISGEPFQFWKLTVNQNDNTAVLSCEDGNGKLVHSHKIPFTDFPLSEIKLYFTNNVILLPSEY